MAELNHTRAMVALLGEICQRRKIRLTAFSDDWIFCLQKDGRVTYVFGYDFDVNSATAKIICKDKAATSDLLAFHEIPRIEHQIFHGPQLAGYVAEIGGWPKMLAYLEAHPLGVVCKPNEGTGGNSVMLARSPAKLEAAVYQVFAKHRSLCLSPYVEIENEYRVALFAGKTEFIYRKVRPTLAGDGRQSVRALLLERMGQGDDFPRELDSVRALAEMKIDWERIPAPGEAVALNWRHNLGLGSKPEILTSEERDWDGLEELAGRAAEALGIQLALVDIVNTSEGLKVLEINSGIMMESLVKIHPDGWAMAARLYDRIVCAALNLEREP